MCGAKRLVIYAVVLAAFLPVAEIHWSNARVAAGRESRFKRSKAGRMGIEWSKVAIGFGCYLLALYPIMAIVEYVAHRWFMHRRSVINKLGYQAHLIEHHILGKDSDWPHIRLRFRDHLLYGSPAIVWMVYRGVTGFTYAFGGVIALMFWFFVHVRLYSAMHRTHHELDHNWTERLPGAELMKRHHLLHHKYPKSNYAVVLGVPFGWPWVDSLFGTCRR